MISISILDSHRARAVEILRDLPVWKGSHRGEAANQVGVLGEVIVREQLSLRGVPAKPIFTTSHDLELSSTNIRGTPRQRRPAIPLRYLDPPPRATERPPTGGLRGQRHPEPRAGLRVRVPHDAQCAGSVPNRSKRGTPNVHHQHRTASTRCTRVAGRM